MKVVFVFFDVIGEQISNPIESGKYLRVTPNFNSSGWAWLKFALCDL